MQTNPVVNGATAPPRKRRRWWVYLLFSVGALVLLAVTTLVLLVGYYHSLIKKYTTTNPVALARVEFTPADQETLKHRWIEFHQTILSGQPTPPFVLSEADLNLMIASNHDLNGRVALRIEPGRIRADFSLPLDKTGKSELKGRFLNGTAWFECKLAEDGFPSLQVQSIQANGKPVPGWFAAKVKNKNLLDDLYRNPHLLDLVNQIEDLEVAEDQLVITPLNSL